VSRLRYFPLTTDRFEHQFGVRALLAEESVIERTESFDAEISLKRQLLAADQANHYQDLPGSEPAQQEAAELLIGRRCPLLEAAVEIQEDVVILSGHVEAGHPIIAGVVCFPSGWTIADKIGQSIDTVHAPVPEYAEVMSGATNQLLQRLRGGRPVWRMNWGVRPSGRLDQSPKQLEAVAESVPKLTTENVGEECFFRVERQTLSRLPETNAILFAIHTHQCRLSELESDQQSNLLGVLKTCPAATAKYKGFDSIADVVCEYLRAAR
jgi:hypothetical protein